LTLNFQKMFDKFAKDNEREWSHNRSLTVGASEQFQCIRRTFFQKNGYTPDPDFQESYGATTRGSLLEAHYVVPALLNAMPEGSELLWAGDDQVTLIDGRLSATPDGLITELPANALAEYGIEDIESNCITVEIKTFDSRIDLTEPKPVHAGQVQQQMGLIHLKTNHRPEYAVILYVNAAWLDDIRPFVIKRDPAIFEVCRKRADMVYEAKDPKELQPEGKIGGGKECAFCPFQQQCAEATLNAVPVDNDPYELAPADAVRLGKLLKSERRMKFQIKELEALHATKVEEVKQTLRDLGKGFAKVDGYTVTYKRLPGRKTYDTKRMAEENGIDLEDYVKESQGSERLTIKAPNDDED